MMTAQKPANISAQLGTETLLRNRYGCQPDVADPVWGAGGSLIGYSCHAAAN
jgi:hypothetical protein